MVYSWLQSLESWVFPPVCVVCGGAGFAAEEPLDLCAECYREMPQIRRPCRRCSAPLPHAESNYGLCGKCISNPPVCASSCAPFIYAEPVAGLVRRLKFNGDLVCGRTLGLLLADILANRAIDTPEILIPVPLHASRHRLRGFNQALEIARPVAKQLRLPLDTRSCRRVRATGEQTGLNAQMRRRNVKGAFDVRPLGPIKHVAIVDDVITTGSTAEALCHALLSAGVERVDVWAVARTVRDATDAMNSPVFHWMA